LLKELCEELFCHIFDAMGSGNQEHRHIFDCDAPASVFLHLFEHIQRNDHNLLQLLSGQNNQLFYPDGKMRHIRRRSKNTRSRLTALSVSLIRKGDHVLKMLTFRKMQKCTPTPPARRPGGGSGGAWTVLREQDLQRSPPDRLFAYFLGETRK
jgi:hypothetical protein